MKHWCLVIQTVWRLFIILLRSDNEIKIIWEMCYYFLINIYAFVKNHSHSQLASQTSEVTLYIVVKAFYYCPRIQKGEEAEPGKTVKWLSIRFPASKCLQSGWISKTGEWWWMVFARRDHKWLRRLRKGCLREEWACFVREMCWNQVLIERAASPFWYF